MQALELKLPPLLLLLIDAVAMWFIARWLPALHVDIPWRLALAAALLAGGCLIALAGVAEFRRARTTVDPTNPDGTSAMVTSGIYRRTRNPMYLGFLLSLCAWAVFLEHLLAFAFLPAFLAYMNRFQIAPEERFLGAKFGAEFAAYTQRTRRWL